MMANFSSTFRADGLLAVHFDHVLASIFIQYHVHLKLSAWLVAAPEMHIC
jgi:hypothetical protein